MNVRLFRFCVVVVAFLFLAAAVPYRVLSQGAPPGRARSAFELGEKVEVKRAGDWIQGEAVDVNESSGWVKVSFTLDGHDTTMSFPPHSALKVAEEPDAAEAEKKPDQPRKAGRIRTWTDASGEHKTKARFVELVDGKVRLKKVSGDVIALPLDQLSLADQNVAKRLARQQADEASSAEANDVGEDSESQRSLRGAREFTVNPLADAAIVPDAFQSDLPSDRGPIPLKPLNSKLDPGSFMEKPNRIFLDREHQRFIVSYVRTDLRGGGECRLECCSLKTARSLGSVILPTLAVPVDISPDGSTVVCLPPKHGVHSEDDKNVVEVWRLDRGGKLVKRWDAGTNESGRYIVVRAVNCAMFISSDLVMTVNSSTGKAILWDIGRGKAVYVFKMRVGCRPALSANRKQLAVMSDAGAAVVDSATGATLAALRGDPDDEVIFAFRSDGRQLAALSDGKLRIWDLENKVVASDVWLAHPVPQDRLEWIGDSCILAGGAFVIDVAGRIVLWQYFAQGPTLVMPDGKVCFTWEQTKSASKSGGTVRQPAVHFVTLPHSEATRMAALVTEDEQLAVRPGIKVILDIRIPTAKPQELKQIADVLAERLERNGVDVVDSGTKVVLSATVEAGRSETKQYESRSFGRMPGGPNFPGIPRVPGVPGMPSGPGMPGREIESVTVTEQISRLAFKEDGRTVWDRHIRTGAVPFIVMRKKGQSLADAIAETQPSTVSFFLVTPLPKYLARPPEKGIYGMSVLTPAGPMRVVEDKQGQ